MKKRNSSAVPSLQTVAEASGVSCSTVSRALRDNPIVRLSVRRKVQKIAKEIGYRHDPKLTELMIHMRRGRTREVSEMLAVVISGSRKEYLQMGKGALGPMLDGLERKLKSQGFGLEVFHLADYDFDPKRLSRILWNRGIRGVVIDTLRPEDARLALDWHRFSAATTSFSLAKPLLHRVCHYHLHGMRMACRKLWDLGYRRIGLAMDFRNDVVADHSYLSGYYFESIQRTGQLRAPFLHRGLKQEPLGKWLKETRPDAVLIPGLGLDYLEMFERLGRGIPGDLGVATLNLRGKDSPLAGIIQRRDVVGETVANLVAEMVFRNETGIPAKPITHQVEGEWKAGATVRKIPRPKK